MIIKSTSRKPHDQATPQESSENQCQERERRTTHRPGRHEKKPAVAAKAKSREGQKGHDAIMGDKAVAKE
jgi:hypothetical protein